LYFSALTYATRRILWVTTCACCVVPTFKILKKNWWMIIAFVFICIGIVSVEMKRNDVTTTTFTMNNGYTIPALGLGTWQSGSKTKRAVRSALDEGYRHIDAASIYGNEHHIGEALKLEFQYGTLDREDVFITSKLWNTDHHPSRVEQACRESLQRLGLQYLDLYLIHWPMAYASISDSGGSNSNSNSNSNSGDGNSGDNSNEKESQTYTNPMIPINKETGRIEHDNNIDFTNTWEAMEQLVAKGLVRSIGLSNFNKTQINDILGVANIAPQVLQIENHPYLPQYELVEYAKLKGMVVFAYSPLGSPGRPARWDRGRYSERPPDLLKHKGMSILEDKYGKTKAQLLLRWNHQRGRRKHKRYNVQH